MILPHLLEHRYHGILVLLRDGALKVGHQSLLIGLHAWRQPHRGGLDIADQMGGAALKGPASKDPDKIREVVQIILRGGIGPASGRIHTEGENDRSNEAGLIAYAGRLDVTIPSSIRRDGTAGRASVQAVRPSLRREQVPRGVRRTWHLPLHQDYSQRSNEKQLITHETSIWCV